MTVCSFSSFSAVSYVIYITSCIQGLEVNVNHKLLWFGVSSPGFIVLKLTFLFISVLMETPEGFRPQNISESSLKIRGKKRKWIWKQQEAKLI